MLLTLFDISVYVSFFRENKARNHLRSKSIISELDVKRAILRVISM